MVEYEELKDREGVLSLKNFIENSAPILTAYGVFLGILSILVLGNNNYPIYIMILGLITLIFLFYAIFKEATHQGNVRTPIKILVID